MGYEIERKFLIDPAQLPSGLTGQHYRQGFVSGDEAENVRVRIRGDEQEALIIIKTKLDGGLARSVIACGISMEDAKVLMARCAHPPVEKIRYRLEHEGTSWTVDEFLGGNKGLWLAEIELGSEDETFAKPSWLREEVSHHGRYYNTYLAKHPFSQWGDAPQPSPRLG